MKTLITYYSETGNTKILAQQIYLNLKHEKEIQKIELVKSVQNYDLIFIGFPIHNGFPAKPAINLIEKINSKVKVVLFTTHAMKSTSPLHNLQLKNCKKIAKSLNTVGFYSCQGELSSSFTKRFCNKDKYNLHFFKKIRESSVGHPNKSDLNTLSNFTKHLQINEL